MIRKPGGENVLLFHPSVPIFQEVEWVLNGGSYYLFKHFLSPTWVRISLPRMLVIMEIFKGQHCLVGPKKPEQCTVWEEATTSPEMITKCLLKKVASEPRPGKTPNVSLAK